MEWIKISGPHRGRYHAVVTRAGKRTPGYCACGACVTADVWERTPTTPDPPELERCSACLQNLMRSENHENTPLRRAVQRYAVGQGTSLSAVARKVGMTRQAMQQILDRNSCTLATFRRIAQELDVKASALLATIEQEELKA